MRGRGGVALGVVTVLAGVAGLLAGCTGANAAAQDKAACQKYCGQIAALVNEAERDCPDPGTLATAPCAAWIRSAAGLAGQITGLPDPVGGDISAARKDLQTYRGASCGSQTASAGANSLTNCEQNLEDSVERLYLAREGMAAGATTVPPPTAADFTWTLRLASAPLNTALARLPHASSPTQVGADATYASAAAQAASTAVGTNVLPPQAAASAATNLSGALGSLYGQLLAQAGSSTSDLSCGLAASTLAGLAAVGTGTAYRDDLPTAIRGMAAAGYPVPLVLPVMPVLSSVRPGNGTLLKDSAAGGQGTLTISGSSGADAVVELVSGHATVVKVYVRQGSTAHVNGIRDGTYDVYTATGADWDNSATSFTRSCQFQETNTPLNYRTTSTTYTTYSITIDAVVGGNTTVTPVNSHDFPH